MCCFLSFFLSVLFSGPLTGAKGGEAECSFHLPDHKMGNCIPPFIAYPSFFILSSQTQLPKRKFWPRVHSPRLSNLWAFQWLCLPLAFFLKQKYICRQRIKGTFAERTSLSFWAPLQQKGLVAALRFSSPPCVSLLLILTGSINATSRRSCYWKESLPLTSDMKVEVWFFLVS